MQRDTCLYISCCLTITYYLTMTYCGLRGLLLNSFAVMCLTSQYASKPKRKIRCRHAIIIYSVIHDHLNHSQTQRYCTHGQLVWLLCFLRVPVTQQHLTVPADGCLPEHSFSSCSSRQCSQMICLQSLQRGLLHRTSMHASHLDSRPRCSSQ